MAPSATLLLLLAALAPCAPSSLRGPRAASADTLVSALVSTSKADVKHAYWLRRLYGVEASEHEVACARNWTVLHAQTRTCASLFQQGPCAAREWLELDGPGLRAVCRRRPCAPGYGFVAGGARGRCVLDEDLCPKGSAEEYRYALGSGSGGSCQCKGFRLRGPDGACHIAFSQGPCRPRQILMPSYSPSLEASRGACAPVPCNDGEVRVETEESTGAICAPLGNLDCTAVLVPLFDTIGDVYVPLCDDPTRFSIKVPTRPSVCLRDNQGRCMRALVRSLQPYDWSIESENSNPDNSGGGGDDDDRIVYPKSAAADTADDLFTRYLTPCALLLVLLGI